MSHPKDVDLSKNLEGTFGCVEFEEAAAHIIRWLADESKKEVFEWYESGEAGKRKC